VRYQFGMALVMRILWVYHLTSTICYERTTVARERKFDSSFAPAWFKFNSEVSRCKTMVNVSLAEA